MYCEVAHPGQLPRVRLITASLCLAIGLAAGCVSRQATDWGGDYSIGYRERGVASWYGEEFQGRATASGERYDMHGLTAAHRTLPLGSVVAVRSMTTGRTVTVRVNDRGPFVRGRILDLSLGAARALGMVGTGTDDVELTVIGGQGIHTPGV